MLPRSKQIYENCTVLDINGKQLFRANKKKLDWYLSRNLAKSINDHTIQLTFVNKGDGRQDRPFYLQDMVNQCVICGERQDLTMHHIVPYQYRQHMDLEIKSHSSFDLLPVCMSCHDQYERHAVQLKKHLAKCFDQPLGGAGWIDRKDIGRAARAAGTLLKPNTDRIPEERLVVLRNMAQEVAETRIALFSDDSRIHIDTWEDLDESLHRCVLEELCQMEVRIPGPDFCSHGKAIVDAVSNAPQKEYSGKDMCRQCEELANSGIPALVGLWRRHFLEYAQPKHLPQHWMEQVSK